MCCFEKRYLAVEDIEMHNSLALRQTDCEDMKFGLARDKRMFISMPSLDSKAYNYAWDLVSSNTYQGSKNYLASV